MNTQRFRQSFVPPEQIYISDFNFGGCCLFEVKRKITPQRSKQRPFICFHCFAAISFWGCSKSGQKGHLGSKKNVGEMVVADLFNGVLKLGLPIEFSSTPNKAVMHEFSAPLLHPLWKRSMFEAVVKAYTQQTKVRGSNMRPLKGVKWFLMGKTVGKKWKNSAINMCKTFASKAKIYIFWNIYNNSDSRNRTST